MDTDETQITPDGRDGDNHWGMTPEGCPPREWILWWLFLAHQCLCPSVPVPIPLVSQYRNVTNSQFMALAQSGGSIPDLPKYGATRLNLKTP
ncbi:hypothetical protein IAD21_05065 [Abditibacteriota bacterium]|nr:hypothetical protein IAD21_05065 [Abditibacteriota bacterium]